MEGNKLDLRGKKLNNVDAAKRLNKIVTSGKSGEVKVLLLGENLLEYVPVEVRAYVIPGK